MPLHIICFVCVYPVFSVGLQVSLHVKLPPNLKNIRSSAITGADVSLMRNGAYELWWWPGLPTCLNIPLKFLGSASNWGSRTKTSHSAEVTTAAHLLRLGIEINLSLMGKCMLRNAYELVPQPTERFSSTSSKVALNSSKVALKRSPVEFGGPDSRAHSSILLVGIESYSDAVDGIPDARGALNAMDRIESLFHSLKYNR